MSADQVSDLYRQLAVGRARQAFEALRGAGDQRMLADGAAALERAAGALACITALYTRSDTELSRRWHDQIDELIAIAASLEHVADVSRHREP